jgi:hypothetical protein
MLQSHVGVAGEGPGARQYPPKQGQGGSYVGVAEGVFIFRVWGPGGDSANDRRSRRVRASRDRDVSVRSTPLPGELQQPGRVRPGMQICKWTGVSRPLYQWLLHLLILGLGNLPPRAAPALNGTLMPGQSPEPVKTGASRLGEGSTGAGSEVPRGGASML